MIRLNDRDPLKARIEELTAKLEQLPPSGRREAIYQEKFAELTPRERAAFDRAPAERNDEEQGLVGGAQPKLQITPTDLANRVDPAQRDEAKKISAEIDEVQATLDQVERSREVTNYTYWLARCELERRPETLQARSLIHQADNAFRVDQDLLAAQKLYQDGFAKWDEVLKQFPALRTDDIFTDDMMIFIKRYRTLLKRLDQQFPEHFPLQDILDSHRET
jgi:hypothetical protein